MIFGITANYLAPFTKVAVSQSSKVPANSHPGQGRHGVGRHRRRHSRRRRIVQGDDRHQHGYMLLIAEDAPALIDLTGGQIQVMFDLMPASIEYIRTGKLRTPVTSMRFVI